MPCGASATGGAGPPHQPGRPDLGPKFSPKPCILHAFRPYLKKKGRWPRPQIWDTALYFRGFQGLTPPKNDHSQIQGLDLCPKSAPNPCILRVFGHTSTKRGDGHVGLKSGPKPCIYRGFQDLTPHQTQEDGGRRVAPTRPDRSRNDGTGRETLALWCVNHSRCGPATPPLTGRPDLGPKCSRQPCILQVFGQTSKKGETATASNLGHNLEFFGDFTARPPTRPKRMAGEESPRPAPTGVEATGRGGHSCPVVRQPQ